MVSYFVSFFFRKNPHTATTKTRAATMYKKIPVSDAFIHICLQVKNQTKPVQV